MNTKNRLGSRPSRPRKGGRGPRVLLLWSDGGGAGQAPARRWLLHCSPWNSDTEGLEKITQHGANRCRSVKPRIWLQCGSGGVRWAAGPWAVSAPFPPLISLRPLRCIPMVEFTAGTTYPPSSASDGRELRWLVQTRPPDGKLQQCQMRGAFPPGLGWVSPNTE